MHSDRVKEIRLQEVGPGQVRVLVSEMRDYQRKITPYLVEPAFQTTLTFWGLKDGSPLPEQLFENLVRQGKLYRRDNEPQMVAPHPRDLNARIQDFFEAVECYTEFPDPELFWRDIVNPVLELEDGAIRNEFLADIAYRLKDCYLYIGDEEKDAIGAILRSFVKIAPASLHSIVTEALLRTEPTTQSHATPETAETQEAINAESHGIRAPMMAPPDLLNASPQPSAHPITDEQFLYFVKALLPPSSHFAHGRRFAVVGRDPWSPSQLSELLASRGVATGPLTPGSNCVVVGASGVDVPSLRKWLNEGADQRYVYPQELLMIYLLSGEDPLPVITESQAGHWISYHPILRELFFFDQHLLVWPMPSERNQPFDDRQTIVNLEQGESPLAKLSYSVSSVQQLTATERRDVLLRAFEGPLPSIDPQPCAEHYMAQWGAPGTAKRLWRIAKHLAGLIYLNTPNIQRQRAVSLWKDDLNWLQEALYPRVRYRFTWPRVFRG